MSSKHSRRAPAGAERRQRKENWRAVRRRRARENASTPGLKPFVATSKTRESRLEISADQSHFRVARDHPTRSERDQGSPRIRHVLEAMAVAMTIIESVTDRSAQGYDTVVYRDGDWWSAGPTSRSASAFLRASRRRHPEHCSTVRDLDSTGDWSDAFTTTTRCGVTTDWAATADRA
jgi:hypothetical protein